MAEIRIKPHSEKQDRAMFSDKRYLLLSTGTQYGKTMTGALRMALKTSIYTSPDDNFIITAPSYPIMVQSTLPPFLKLMADRGSLNKKDNSFKIHNGGTVWLRTETDPDSVVGITNVRHIWGDEAGKYRLYFWENLQARADFCGCGIDLTTSPYSLNWIYKDVIKPYREGRAPNWEIIQASSWENPYHSLHDPEKLKEKRAMMDPRRFDMIFGGEFNRMQGLVYDCWDDDQNLVDAFQFPVGTEYIGGIDWGYYPDPFVLKVRAITPDGRHYGISEFVKTRLTITDIVDIVRQKKEVYGVRAFYCDPSQPGYIEELNRAGLTAIGSDNDIRRGIDLHYELIKTRRYKEFKGACPHSYDEREQYHYPEPKDLSPDQNSKDQLPVDQGNHCMDVDRYVTISTYRSSGQKLKPREPEPGSKFKSRLDYLKHSSRNRNHEDWST